MNIRASGIGRQAAGSGFLPANANRSRQLLSLRTLQNPNVRGLFVCSLQEFDRLMISS